MDSSNLQNLAQELLQPIQANPQLLIDKLLPDNMKKLLLSLNGLMALMPGKSPIQVDSIASDLINKIGSLPTSFWIELEHILAGVINGEEAAIEQAKQFLGW